MRHARLAEIKATVENGGYVEFRHLDSSVFLVDADGKRKLVDGRSYDGFQRTYAKSLKRTEVGSIEDHNLVIEWRKAQ